MGLLWVEVSVFCWELVRHEVIFLMAIFWSTCLGYSWLTNQYGLTVDTVTAFELVKPDGQLVTVTEASDPNLFFGLKVRYHSMDCESRLLSNRSQRQGGGNNFVSSIRFPCADSLYAYGFWYRELSLGLRCGHSLKVKFG